MFPSLPNKLNDTHTTTTGYDVMIYNLVSKVVVVRPRVRIGYVQFGSLRLFFPTPSISSNFDFIISTIMTAGRDENNVRKIAVVRRGEILPGPGAARTWWPAADTRATIVF